MNKEKKGDQTKEEQELNKKAETDSEDVVEETEEVSLEDQLAQSQDRLIRLTAEYQNYRKRVEKEKSDLIKYSSEHLFTQLLQLMDTMERAMDSVKDCEDEVMKQGLELMKKSLNDIFENNGVKKIDAVHQAFDHEKHHAVLTEEVEGMEADQVIAVLQDGYTLNQKVIRPSMVKVSK